MLRNSDTRLTRELYAGFGQQRAQVLRAISCKGSGRTGYRELLVYNYT